LGFVAHSFFFRNLHQVGSMIEVLFFSIALADQINILRNEKEQAEAEKFRITKENETILAEQNKMLDEMVRERTKDLENTKAELVSQNEYISQKNMAVEKQALALEDLNQSKDKIFSIVAHDLRSPLSSLQSMFSLLETTEISVQEFYDFLPDLTRKINNAFDLTEEVLYWARNQMNVIEIISVDICLSELFEELVLRFKEQTVEKGLSLENQLSDDSLKACADVDMVKTILRNLVSNAIKFCKKGNQITLNAFKKEKYIEVVVADTGIGILEENIIKLFTTKTFTTYGTANEKGTGLGLTLCKELVEKNGGTIWVKSIAGKGSDFYFTLPMQ
jgi:two-component system, sensor histidine kinase and response regulator